MAKLLASGLWGPAGNQEYTIKVSINSFSFFYNYTIERFHIIFLMVNTSGTCRFFR